MAKKGKSDAQSGLDEAVEAGKALDRIAADDRHEAAAGAADDAGAAGVGQEAPAETGSGPDAPQPAVALDAGPHPGAADAGPDAADAGADAAETADEEEGEAGNGEWEPNVERATFAAIHAYGEDVSFTGYTVDDDSVDLPEHRRLMEAAAAFVRANADAPAAAIPIELGLRGFIGLPETRLCELAAWRVFAFTLRELDRLDAELQAREAAAQTAASPRPVAAAGDLALMPQPDAFAPTGFSPRR